MSSSSTLTMNAGQKLLTGTLKGIDFAALRAAFDAETGPHVARHKTLLLTLAAQSAAPGAVAALRDHGLVLPTGEKRLSHAALRDVHAANALDVAAILDEDIRAMRANPAAMLPVAEGLWAWQLLDQRIQRALVALGLRPAPQRIADEFPFHPIRWRLGGNSVRKAADALLA